MFTSVSSRTAAAYQRISVETVSQQTSPAQVVAMLLDGLLKNVGAARAALKRGDIAGKGQFILKAVRIVDEGLRPALDMERGGEIAANLNGLYAYCVLRLTEGNLNNSDQALAEVIKVVEPLVDSWKRLAEQSDADPQFAS